MPVTFKRIDHGKKGICSELKSDLVAKVGFPFEKNPIHKEARIRVAELALVHEFGSEKRHIPSRPFMRLAGKRNRAKARILFGAVMRLVATGKITMRQAMARMGVWFSGEMKESITQHGGELAPLKRSTIARKKSSKPLLDTTGMKNAITSVVTRKDAVK